MKFARKVVNDIGETLCPIILVTRRPDGTGLYQMYKGIVSALEGSVPIKTLFLGENATIDKIREVAWQTGASSIVFCEAFYNYISSQELSALKAEVSLLVGLVFPWDSTDLDPIDVNCINECVDVVLPICEEYANLWKNRFDARVTVKHIQLALPLGAYETIAYRRESIVFGMSKKISILSVASFHPRKNHDITILAVKNLRDRGVDCCLRLHSNLNQGEYEKLSELGKSLLGENCIVSCGELSGSDLLDLYMDSDIYVSSSQGEGCNIGLRSALSSGMPIVFTNIPGHRDLLKFRNGVFPVDANDKVAGVYPERSNQAFGYQYQTNADYIALELEKAAEFIQSSAYKPGDISRQNGEQDERRSKLYMWDLFASCKILLTHQKLGARRNGHLEAFEDRLILPSLDAGFFSIVNTYLSHKFFWEYPGLYDEVIPVWTPEMVSLAHDKPYDKFTSYCYSKVKDGNAFAHLFGSQEEQAISEIDYENCTFAGTSANAWVDPNLTYIHSEKLYKSAIFDAWRNAMSNVFWSKFCLRPDILQESAAIFSDVLQYDSTMAMHVRHPSHAIEQRDKSIALVKDYIKVAREWLSFPGEGKTRAIILATDQQEVVNEFENNFPGRVIFRKNVSRVSTEDAENEKLISDDMRLKEGRQIQHLLAGNVEAWSLQNARDVISDALLLSMADVLVHVNSNIATAVSVFNPGVEMFHIRGGDDYMSLVSRSRLLASFKLH